IADKDIICYKVIKKDLQINYGSEKWEFNKAFHMDIETKNGDEVIYVNKAFFAYKTIKDAFVSEHEIRYPHVIVECTIPQFTRFYEGRDNCSDTQGYASETLIVNRIIPQEEAFPDIDFENFLYKVGQTIEITDDVLKPRQETIEHVYPIEDIEGNKYLSIMTNQCLSIFGNMRYTVTMEGQYEAPFTLYLSNDYIKEKPIRFTNPAIKIIS
ncbi:MAG: hypothetical protein J6Y78_05775, partial [Paludibacteraceae bacterium]|nr:hypothetical protein [Paludibacteraceae bacterium]